ncbi:MAG TPA: LLM class flavin-dependent oxidoreductase [Thermomicrobiales bacterium]
MAQPNIAIGVTVPPKPPLGSLRQLMFAARLLRLDSVLIWDHIQDFFPTALWTKDFTWMASQNASPHEFFEFQVTLGWLAARAGRVRIGVAATEPIRRHPVVIAQAMLTLAHMTKRRPILAIGAGERENIEPYGLDFRRGVSRLEEALQIIQRCFTTTGPIDFSGEFFRLEHGRFDLTVSPKKRPEIWVAGIGPRMLQLTGRYGDGWLPVGMMPPEEYATKLEAVRAAAREAGRDPAAITPAIQSFLVVAPTEEEVRAMLQTKIVRYFGVLAPAELWKRVGYQHPLGDGFRGFFDFVPERFSRADLEEMISMVPTELASQGLIWGTPEQAIAQLRAYVEAGVRHFVISPASAMISRRAMLDTIRALRTIGKALRSG